MGACLRDVRAVPQVRGVGRRRDQEAHQRQVRDPGLPGLEPGQGIRHQPGPDAGHRRHHPDRRELRRQQLQAAGGHVLPVHLPRRRPPAQICEERCLRRTRQGLRREDRQPHHRADLLRRAPCDVECGASGDQARRHEGPEDPRPRRAGLPGVPEGARARTRRRSPLPRSIWRCRTAPSTRRRTRCRRSRRRSSSRYRRTSR